jgi:hypothetical protein
MVMAQVDKELHNMKLDELIERLTEIQQELQDADVDTSDVEVLAGTQPTYPLTNALVGAISGEDLQEASERELPDPERKAVWLATEQVSSWSDYNPYAPKALWEAIR